MWFFKLIKFIYYKYSEKRRMYIMTKFNDYEKFIDEQQKFVSKIKDKTLKVAAMLNLYNGYYFDNQLEKAEETLKSLDTDSLDKPITAIYYYYLINHYIAANNGIMVDKLWEESQSKLEEIKQKQPQFYRNLEINYNNFKGLYEESNKIILQACYDGKDDIFYELLKAEIYFNTGKEKEAKLIINDLLNGDKKLVPIFKERIKKLQVKYMKLEDQNFKLKEKVSGKDKIWLKVRDSYFMTNLLLWFIDVKNMFKNKYVLLILGPIIAAYLWKAIGSIEFKNLTYWNYWNYLILDIFSKLIVINITGLLINYMIRHKKYFKAVLVSLVFLSWLSFCFYAQSYSVSLKARILDLPYVTSRSYIEESTTIKYINIVHKDKYKYIQIETSNKNKFKVFDDDKFYNYIVENCYEGDIVKIKYLPNTKNIIYIIKHS